MAPELAPLDFDDLAETLAALAYPLRLELLEVLGYPRVLGEIRVRPLRGATGSDERTAAKQTVAAHLDRLVETGLVVRGQEEIGGKTASTYVVNPQRLYALTEDLRRLNLRHSGRGRGLDWTGTLESPPRPAASAGARLVVVHGVYEGRAYPLDPEGLSDGAWMIGRARGLTVSLDYDPFVSLENSALRPRGDGYVVTDLYESKNGTSVNWEPLPRGGSRELHNGDVLGVGRSLLVLQGA
jgi:DNA-binding transcriptional ArsR family regulator